MYRKILMAWLVCVVIFVLASCGAPNAPASSVENVSGAAVPSPNSSMAENIAQADTQAVDTLTIAVTKDENSLSPFTYVSSTGLIVNRLIYDTLFTPNLENEIVPWMVADDYKIENNFQSYTFTLLDGQKFHDGSPVTIQDIEFSFTYPKNQNNSSQRKICNLIDRFEILNDKSMTIHLTSPDINFLRSGLASIRIVSRAQYENQPDGVAVTETIGSGMYRLAEYKTGDYYKMEAAEAYFKGSPAVKTIHMPIVEDGTVIQQNLLSGEFAASTSSIGVEMMDTFSSAEHIQIFASEGYSPIIMNINNGKSPMDSKEFRTALTYGINVAGIMETLYGEHATVGTRGVIRPDHPYSVPGLDYTFSSEKANDILDAAGFEKKNANGIRLAPQGEVCSFEILVYSSNPTRIRIAELVAEQLKEVGIEITVKAMEMDTVDAFVWPDFEVSKGRDYDFAMWGWGSSINPDFLVGLFASDFEIGTSNVCGYQNLAFDEKVLSGFKTAQNTEEMNAVLVELQNIIAEDPGLICFGFADNLQAADIRQYSGWKAGKGTNIINIYSFLTANP